MKKLDIINIIILIPIVIFLIATLGNFIFGCSFSESDMIAHCQLKFTESIMTFFNGLMLFLAFSGIIWFIPALVISFISFTRDYNEIKLNNLPLRSIFKKISFYSFIPFLVICIV